MSGLHSRIMNIGVSIPNRGYVGSTFIQAYKLGHRDARHAAAELAAAEYAGKAELLEALESMVAAWDTVCDLKGWDKDHMPASATARTLLKKHGATQ